MVTIIVNVVIIVIIIIISLSSSSISTTTTFNFATLKDKYGVLWSHVMCKLLLKQQWHATKFLANWTSRLQYSSQILKHLCDFPLSNIDLRLQSSQCSKIRVAQHWGRRGAHLSENKNVKSECKKFGENSRQMASASTIFDEYCSFEAWRLTIIGDRE